MSVAALQFLLLVFAGWVNRQVDILDGGRSADPARLCRCSAWSAGSLPGT
jgi:hypothetical protein